MFGKLIDGVIEYAPRMLETGGMRIHNPTEEQLVAAGYKLIEDTDEPVPSERQKVVESSAEDGSRIYISYTLAELTAEELTLKYQAMVKDRIHSVYSYDDELGLVNDGIEDAENEDYLAYRQFVTETKAAVKAELGIAEE